jgi:hypothetical protein
MVNTSRPAAKTAQAQARSLAPPSRSASHGFTDTSESHGPAWVRVEWAGRVGHTSSYALLGGACVDKSAVRIQPSGAKFRDSLASGTDDVRWGSQPEFEVAILDALQSQPRGVLVSQAAHGAIGSSPYAFARLARFLGRILATDVPAEDAEVWRLFDQVWSDPLLR